MKTDSNDISADGKAVSPDALANWIALTRERYHCGDRKLHIGSTRSKSIRSVQPGNNSHMLSSAYEHAAVP